MFFSYILDVWIIYNKIRTIKHHLSAHKLCVCVFVKKNEVQVRPYEYRESQVIFFFFRPKHKYRTIWFQFVLWRTALRNINYICPTYVPTFNELHLTWVPEFQNIDFLNIDYLNSSTENIMNWLLKWESLLNVLYCMAIVLWITFSVDEFGLPLIIKRFSARDDN